jgi:hypothetical protein
MGSDDADALAEEKNIIVWAPVALFEIEETPLVQGQNEACDKIRLCLIALAAVEIRMNETNNSTFAAASCV